MSAVEALQTASVDLGALLDAGDGAVVTLEAGDTQVAAHRAVLAARSPVFKAMFRHDTLESSSGVVRIADMEGPVLRQLLSYCYSLRVSQLPDMAYQLLSAADRYGLSDLKAACEQQLAAQMDVENAAASAVLAVRHSCPNLTAAAIAFIKSQNYQVMGTQGWTEAMKNQPDDLSQVCRLLAEPPPKTRTPATEVCRTPSSIHNDLSWTAATTTPPCQTLPPDGAAVSRFQCLSADEKGHQLMVAATNGNVGVLRALLVAGADLMARDETRWTALHRATYSGQAEAVRFLVEAGAEMDARDSSRATPLHYAARSGRTGMVRLLLASSPNLNARDYLQQTPLHWAADRGHAEVVAALLQAGADGGARDNRGNTPLDIARRSSHQEVIDLLT